MKSFAWAILILLPFRAFGARGADAAVSAVIDSGSGLSQFASDEKPAIPNLPFQLQKLTQCQNSAVIGKIAKLDKAAMQAEQLDLLLRQPLQGNITAEQCAKFLARIPMLSTFDSDMAALEADISALNDKPCADAIKSKQIILKSQLNNIVSVLKPKCQNVAL